MSVAFYIVPERQIEGFSHFVNGKALGHIREDQLTKLCQRLGVKPLASFYSQVPDELADFLDDEGFGVIEAPETTWFEAADGLATIHALIRHLQDNPNDLHNASNCLADLYEYRDVLARLAEEGIRWFLALDF